MAHGKPSYADVVGGNQHRNRWNRRNTDGHDGGKAKGKREGKGAGKGAGNAKGNGDAEEEEGWRTVGKGGRHAKTAGGNGATATTTSEKAASAGAQAHRWEQEATQIQRQKGAAGGD